MKKWPQDSHDFYKISKFDGIIVSLILLVSIFFIVKMYHKNSGTISLSNRAMIYHENKLLTRVNLMKDDTVSLTGVNMKVEVKDRKIRVSESDCPHKLCMNTGWARYTHQTIVCVPNHILIEIQPAGPVFLDAVAN